MIYNVCITKAVVSPGYDKTEALKFSDSGDVVRFRVGIPHYDANAENNTYWENETVKAFGPICEQIKKMKLKEGAVIALAGEKSFDSWEDEEGEIKHASVIKLSKVEYVGSGKKSDSDDDDEEEEEPPKSKPKKTEKKGTASVNKKAYAPVSSSEDYY
jgi:single-stranded DNA-binding protein